MEPHTIVTWAYLAVLSLLGIYGLHRLALLTRFRWGSAGDAAGFDEADLPAVTVQLPIFNERTVARRLIQAAGALDYPLDRLEIQVLDDSTDETTDIVRGEVDALVARGVDAVHVRRDTRVGYKAGALENGTKLTENDLFCVFDADFLPETDFLRQLVGPLADPSVGMVQARWGHVNRDESLLTRAQSTLLDGHFVIEHTARHGAGLFFNFNGTAGVWRRAAIEDAGGWQHDTLTEDLDLSYRAQLAGWKFVYSPNVVAPAEVPPDIAAFKSQQHRWAKGSVQVFKKLGRPIAASQESWRVKLEAFAHLTGNVGYPAVLALALLLPLAAGTRTEGFHWWHLAAFVVCTLSVALFYERSQRAIGRSLGARLRDSLAAISLGIGMCVSQTRAVIEGLGSRTGSFVRTPKRGDSAPGRRYRASLAGLPGIELLLAAWFVFGLVAATRQGNWGSLPFLLLFFTAFAWVGGLSLRDHLARA